MIIHEVDYDVPCHGYKENVRSTLSKRTICYYYYYVFEEVSRVSVVITRMHNIEMHVKYVLELHNW